MRRWRFTLILAAGIAGLAATAIYWWTHGQYLVSTNNAYVHAEITTVSARLDGFIAEIHVHDNQTVQSGELLATIDASRYIEMQNEAAAKLRSTQALIDHLHARKMLQTSLVRQAEAEINVRAAELEGIEQTLMRLRSLRAQDHAAREALDQQEVLRKGAQAQWQKSQEQLSAEKYRLAVLKSERLELAARIEQHEAELELARLKVANTRIYAPVSGIVGRRNLRPGQYVKAATPLLSIVPSAVWVEANFKETQIRDFRVGMKAQIEADAFPGQVIEGSVHSLSPATGARFSLLPPENATGNFTKIVQRVPVRISLPADVAADMYLVPGLSVVVTIDTRH